MKPANTAGSGAPRPRQDARAARSITRARLRADKLDRAERIGRIVGLVLLVAFSLCALGVLVALTGYAGGAR